MKDTANLSAYLSGFPWDKLFPDILWIIFWIVILIVTKDFIRTAITTLLNRLKHGAGVKIGSFELEGLKVVAGSNFQNNNFQITKDLHGIRQKKRASIYAEQRGAMLVHKIYKSQKEGHLYDILIYLIPKKGLNIIQVTSVDYYFGKFWDNAIFTSTDRSNGFAIATSACGPFLCTAQINFNDGKSETAYRFIDFEMGDVAACTRLELRTHNKSIANSVAGRWSNRLHIAISFGLGWTLTFGFLFLFSSKVF